MENRIHRTEIQIYVSPFLIVIFLLMSISSYAQQIIAKQMPFLEQLPSNEVIDLHQDQNGFIWLGTKNGLGRMTDTNSRLSNQTLTSLIY